MATIQQEIRATPPYVSFKTLLTYMDDLKGKDHLPHQIDRSVMPKMSGITQNQVLSAMRFLGLVDENDKVTGLQTLVDARGTLKFSEVFAGFIHQAYAGIIGTIDIESATQKQLRDSFRESSNVEGETLEKAVRFYLKALKEAGSPFSSHLTLRQSRGGRRSSLPKQGKQPVQEQKGGKINQNQPPLPGTITIPLHLPTKQTGSITFPEDLDEADCDMIDTIIRAYAKRRQGIPAKPK